MFSFALLESSAFNFDVDQVKQIPESKLEHKQNKYSVTSTAGGAS